MQNATGRVHLGHLAGGTWHLAGGTWHLAGGTWHLHLHLHLAGATWHLHLAGGTWPVAPDPRRVSLGPRTGSRPFRFRVPSKASQVPRVTD